MAGTLSKGIKLSYKASSEAPTFTELTNLQEIPELGGTSEKVDVTVLSDASKKYIDGIKDYGELAFKFLYDNAGTSSSYRILQGLEGSATATVFQVTLPDTTSFEFSGFVTTKIDGAGVGAALTFTATISLNSEIEVTHPEA